MAIENYLMDDIIRFDKKSKKRGSESYEGGYPVVLKRTARDSGAVPWYNPSGFS
jgi:hypothetical protein